MPIQIFFKTLAGKTLTKTASQAGPSFDEFRKIAQEVTAPDSDVSGYRFIIGTKQIVMEPAVYEGVRELITNQCNIFVVMRLLGGGMVEVDLLWDVLQNELDAAMEKCAKRKPQVGPCVVCLGDVQSVFVVCCTTICAEQLRNCFKAKNGKFTCLICDKAFDLGAALGSPELSSSLATYDETQQLLTNIDVQICHCGWLLVNESRTARQKCRACARVFCFFCNKAWDREMADRKYTCGKACDYETRISYELVEFSYNSAFRVPNRRCCPACLNLGAYDGKCKYHTCTHCQHSFCFICLKPEAECGQTSNYKSKCGDVVKQRYEDFKHFI